MFAGEPRKRQLCTRGMDQPGTSCPTCDLQRSTQATGLARAHYACCQRWRGGDTERTMSARLHEEQERRSHDLHSGHIDVIPLCGHSRLHAHRQAMHSPIGQLAHEQACSADDLQWSTQATSSVLRLLTAGGVQATIRWPHEERAGGSAGTASARQLLVAVCINALLHDTTPARTPQADQHQAPWTTASWHAPAHHKAVCCECHRACRIHDVVQSASCVTFCKDVTM